MIDLRSDTVTKPSRAMREAMANAEVGDDVYGEDPTVNLLQDRVATLLGKAAALFVPTGSMANQVALKAHTQPGDDVIIGQHSHNWLYESGAGAVISGVQFTFAGQGGLFDVSDLDEVYKADNHHHAPTRLVCVENTHNRGGGRVWPAEQIDRVSAWAHGRNLATHLDGARLWNAHIATGRSPAELAAPFDSVSVCMSKGLGAPVGSLIAGRKDFIWKAHRWRKLMGGGMRQAGILAAAGLYALDHNIARLAEDHANARLLASALAGVRGVSLESAVESNIVIFVLGQGLPDAASVVARARERGVLVNAVGTRKIRALTHLDVDRAAVEKAAALLCELLRS